MGRMIDVNAIRYEPMLSARGNGQYEDVMVAYKDQIDDLPTIEERKTGKWIPDNTNPYETRFICSNCNESQVVPTIGFTSYKPLWDWCPLCGCKMEGE